MVTRTERKALEKEGWQSTGDVSFRLARDLKINGATLSGRLPKVLEALLAEKGEQYQREHVKRFGSRYTFIDGACYENLKEKVAQHC